MAKDTKSGFNAGRYLASPSPGEEVVITGMAGRFPQSNDIYQYRDNLFNKVDMISGTTKRWNPTHPELPKRIGEINFLEKFDAGFFGIQYRQAHSMDPICRLLLEHSFEAILDAGYHPDELRGSNTGVFVGSIVSESEKYWIYDNPQSPAFGLIGCMRSMQAQRISYFFGLKGPSHAIDTACSTTMYALEHAYRSIRMGKCENAIVCAGSLCLNETFTLQFARLGVLCLDGACKSFDADGNGYVRSESVSVIFLQKAKNARRIYARIVHAKTNCDGFKEEGITFPSSVLQTRLLDELYRECNIDPATVDFVEAHATATKAGDTQEVSAIANVFCTTNRRKPLLVGSVKSNIGHTEAASGICSVIKVILGMENSCFFPNIHYKRPRAGADALEKGIMTVVTEVSQWGKNETGLVGVNNFGFGGANGHVALQRFTKEKANNGLPKDDLPRLIAFTGRTNDAINFIADDISKRPLDVEFVRLLQECFKNNIVGHNHRGYIIMSKTGELTRSARWFDGKQRPVCFVFGEVYEELLDVGRNIFAIPTFKAVSQEIDKILTPFGVKMTDILEGASSENVFLGSVAVQIGLFVILKKLELAPDYIIGYSFGKLVAAYADGTLSLEQVILCAYYVSKNLHSLDIENRFICEVALNRKELLSILPIWIEVASCDPNSSCTISGPIAQLETFIRQLKDLNVLTGKIQKCSGFCNKPLENHRTTLFKNLKDVLPKRIAHSERWISTSHKTSKETSAEHFINNLFHVIEINEILLELPSESIVIRFGAKHQDFQDYTNINLVLEKVLDHNYIVSLLICLGRLYELGHAMKFDRLYPELRWPVSRNTPMISPLIKWNHTDDWFVTLYNEKDHIKTGERIISVSRKDGRWGFLTDHDIDGRSLIPGTAYLMMVWETFSMMVDACLSEMSVVFENVRFHRATNIPTSNSVDLIVMIQKGTGQFEISELGISIVSGKLYSLENVSKKTEEMNIMSSEEELARLTSKDIYKELKLRGYKYKGLFCGLSECNLEFTNGLIEWAGNWVTFMESMMHLKLLQEDTRNLYVTTEIEHLSIDAKAHICHIKQLGEKPLIPVYVDKKTRIIRSGGIEVRGQLLTAVTRRKKEKEPILEKQLFVPFDALLTMEESARVVVQLIIENSFGNKHRAVELIDDATVAETTPFGPIVYQAFCNELYIQPEVFILSKNPINVLNINVEDKQINSEVNSCSLVVASKLSSRPKVLKQARKAIKDSGMILSREKLDLNLEAATNIFEGVDIVAVHTTVDEKLILLHKPHKCKVQTVVDMSDTTTYNWLEPLQTALNNDESVLVYSQSNFPNGLLGFYNCLRREVVTSNIRCLFIVDHNLTKFNPENQFYKKQLKKGLNCNVFKDGKWGSYRYLPIAKETVVQQEHVFNNVTVRGDLSSLRWIEGPLTSKSIIPAEQELVHIYYASLNFRDIMTASGRISNKLILKDCKEQYNLLGTEFVGLSSSGRRVMGMVSSGALASMICADSYLLIDIPEDMTMEEAATIPVAYGTVFYGIVDVGQLREGQSILIHGGSGGVGQAALRVAVFYKCNIFTTVDTEEKRKFIKQTFPEIPESHIGTSRDISFEQMVMKETSGRGVDIVLNSLSEEKLEASLRCLAPGGKFIEIGKFDLANNNRLNISLLKERRSFHGILLDEVFRCDPGSKIHLMRYLEEGLKSGCVKPLNRTVFNISEVEKAFRFMAAGKHIGRVIIKMREDVADKNLVPPSTLFNGIARLCGNPEKSYIIIGGLGGLGLELADWLIKRGVRKILLSSRYGLKTGYQVYKMRVWKSYGADVYISTIDTTTKQGCIQLIEQANKMGAVEGIFNLAVVMKDALFENQTMETFEKSFIPKGVITQHLDDISRKMCPELLYFVVTSSLLSGRGSIGQTNYAMANSFMERICEQRKKEGYPALAIQWGAIGDVGLLAEMQETDKYIEVGGTVQQPLTSCLEVLDGFLTQKETIVSCFVVPEKNDKARNVGNIIDVVMNILGLRDLKTISHHSTLSQLGMDSIMVVEIKQTFERDYELCLSAKDIRNMTFARLDKIGLEMVSKMDSIEKKSRAKKELPKMLYMIFQSIGDENPSTSLTTRLQSLIKENSVAPKAFLLPGIDGIASTLQFLAANLSSHAICFQFPSINYPEFSIEEFALSAVTSIEENLSDTTPFTLVCYSYGCTIGLQLVSLLEKKGRIGQVVLIDGSPFLLKAHLKEQLPDSENDVLLQTFILCGVMQMFIPFDVVTEKKADILKCKSFDERLEHALKFVPENTSYSRKHLELVCKASYSRLRSGNDYQPNFPKLKSMVKLFKPSQPIIDKFDEDYKLQELCKNPVEVITFTGDHFSMLKNTKIAYAINAITDMSHVYSKKSV